MIVLVDGAIPAQGGGRGGGGGGGAGGAGFGGQRPSVPPEFAHMVGRITPDRTVPQLKAFLDAGGDIVTIGSSTQLAYMFGLPVSNALVERTPTGGERVLSAEKFYVPGSILTVAVDSTASVAAGTRGHVDVFFDNSPVFRLNPDAALKGVRPIAWFDSESPLRSGWAWGQNYLDGGVAIAEARDLNLWTAVHHHLESRGFRFCGSFLVDHADLHPHRLGADEDRLVDRIGRRCRTAEDVDDVDRHADLRQLAPDIFAVHMLAGDLRVDRKHTVAPILQELHHAVGRPAWPIGSAHERNRPRVDQKLGYVLVAGKRHGAITA